MPVSTTSRFKPDDDEREFKKLIGEIYRKRKDPNYVKFVMDREGYDMDAVTAEIENIQSFETGVPVQATAINRESVREQIFNVDQSQIAEGSKQSYNYGTRMLQAGDVLSETEKSISEKGALEGFQQWVDQKQVGGVLTQRFVPKEFQQVDQAQRNFLNAVLRRESGAVISPEEFESGKKQYFPIPGDDEANLKLKRQNREQATKNFLGQAGVNPELVNKALVLEDEETGDDQARQWLQANPDDPRAEAVRAKLREVSKTPVAPAEKPEEDKGFLAKAGGFAQNVLGGKQIGEAVGEIIGTSLAKHGEAGETFKKSIEDTQKRFQDGRITQEERDKQIIALEKNAKEAFGYKGPNAKQIIGDMATIGLNFVGGAALKGGAGILKMSAIGALTGGAAAMAEDESVGQGAITGGVLGGAFGLIGSGISKIGSKIASRPGVEERAIKLASEILQPSKKEASLAIEKGGSAEAVKALVKNVKKSEDFSELRSHMTGTTEALFEKRNNLLKTNNFDVGEKYLEPLKENIAKLEKDKLVSPAQIDRMKQALEQETAWLAEQGGTVSRLQAQARKEALQELTQPLLKKKNAGNLSLNEANTMKALDSIRFGLKEAVEGGDDVVANINSQYAGLNRAIELISGREAMALNAVELSKLQKVVAPIIELMSASTGAGSAQFVARLASKQQSKLVKLTGKLEKLSQGKGGVFSDMYNFIKKFKGKQGKIGNMLDGLDDYTKNIRPGMNIEDVNRKLGAELGKTPDELTAFLDEIGFVKGPEDLGIKLGELAKKTGDERLMRVTNDFEFVEELYRVAESRGIGKVNRSKSITDSLKGNGESPLQLEAKKYKTADEFVKGQGKSVFHQSQSKKQFNNFKTLGDEGYTANFDDGRNGIYFGESKADVVSKYGEDGGILLEAKLIPKKPLELGKYDSMYFNGDKANVADIAIENTGRAFKDLPELPAPDILLTNISDKAKKWLDKNGYDLMRGKVSSTGAIETVVLDKGIIKTRSQLIDIFNKAHKR